MGQPYGMRWGWEKELWLPAELLRLLSSPAMPSSEVTFSYPIAPSLATLSSVTVLGDYLH